MSNFFSLLPLALDAGLPQEAEPIVVRKPSMEPAPLPKAWLEPSKPPSRIPVYALLLAIFIGVGALDFFTPTDSSVTTTTQDRACPAPQQTP
jgi:hypothetical protein